MTYPAEVPECRAITRFTGSFAFLSSFFKYPIVFEGVLWPTREHAFQAAKSREPAYRKALQEAPEPWDAKRIGQTARLPRAWDTHLRVPVMCSLITAQFADPHLSARLRATGDCLLVEGNYWHDDFWGDCNCGRPLCALPGRNVLGRLLMTARATL